MELRPRQTGMNGGVSGSMRIPGKNLRRRTEQCPQSVHRKCRKAVGRDQARDGWRNMGQGGKHLREQASRWLEEFSGWAVGWRIRREKRQKSQSLGECGRTEGLLLKHPDEGKQKFFTGRNHDNRSGLRDEN